MGIRESDGDDYCAHLEPKVHIITNEDVGDGDFRSWASVGGEELSPKTPFHTCAVKEAMGSDDVRCAFSHYKAGSRPEYIHFDNHSAGRCPDYTTDEAKAERAIRLYPILMNSSLSPKETGRAVRDALGR